MSAVHFDQARREGEVRGHLGAPPSLKNIKYTRMHHLKNQEFFPKRGPTKMFPRVLLWL